ncbi:hypothetical protein ACU8Z2_01965 [Bacillus paranthracis]|nr:MULTISPECIES: hypothetical protein [Bacillus cereus group]HDR3523878.1 hypothetical protein [Bacillus pacificus]MDA2195642.1 hypothetical protein [Bacillus cereus group sp. Bc238]MDA2201188.1 hypothetical protein [Bacillus cereus group sp. Bc237]WCA21587.1 hypothetical protein PGS39_01965 [Bacillus paranthracis]HDR3634401.1 hypothetical protein [Bacillus pacificus]
MIMKKISMAILCIMSAFNLTIHAGEITKDSKEQPVKNQVQYMMSEPGGL